MKRFLFLRILVGPIVAAGVTFATIDLLWLTSFFGATPAQGIALAAYVLVFLLGTVFIFAEKDRLLGVFTLVSISPVANTALTAYNWQLATRNQSLSPQVLQNVPLLVMLCVFTLFWSMRKQRSLVGCFLPAGAKKQSVPAELIIVVSLLLLTHMLIQGDMLLHAYALLLPG